MKAKCMNRRNWMLCLHFFLLIFFIIIVNSVSANNIAFHEIRDTIIDANHDTNYYMYVDRIAAFQKGSINEFHIFVKENLIYPENARNNKVEGNVMIQFGVDCYGNIGFVKIIRSSGNIDLDNEAIRVVKSSPKWVPAKIKRKFVGQYFVTFAEFKL